MRSRSKARSYLSSSPSLCGPNALGKYNILARYYDPATAQFLTVDPDLAKTLSPYGYAGGDPLNAADPTGRGLCLIWQSNCQTFAQSVSSAVTSSLPNCTVFDGSSCQPIVSTGGVCLSGSIYGGIGIQGSACFVSSHGHFGFTASAGYGFGLGGGVGFGPFVSNAPNIQSLGGPFIGAGGGVGPFSGEGAVSPNGSVWTAYGGVSFSTPVQGYGFGTQTWTSAFRCP
jgi:hypothetical protein